MRRDSGSLLLGQYLYAKRTALGLSLRGLAAMVGKAPTTVQSWEQGKRMPSLEDLLVLARLLGTSVEELVYLAVPTPTEIQQQLRKAKEADGVEGSRQATFLRQLLAARKESQRRSALAVLRPLTRVQRVPLVGDVPAGFPKLAVEEGGEYTEVLEGVPVDYALVVRGDSMVGAGIDDGDIVWVRRSAVAQPGDTVVALLQGEEVTVKHLIKEGERYVLRANNPVKSYPDIVLGPEDEIIGVVERVVKRPGPPPRMSSGR